jgi:hypothetical protein
MMLNTKSMVLFGVTPCSLVDRYESFRINHGRRTSQGKGLHLRVLQWAGSRATSGKTTISVIPHRLNYVVIL